MLEKIITLVEWAIGLCGAGGASITFFFIMFTDSPTFGKNFTLLEKFVFNNYALFLIIVLGTVFVAFIAQFFVKTVPWHHVVATAGIIGIVYSAIFLNAYFK